MPNAPIPSQRPVQRPLVLFILSLGLPLSFPAMRQPVDPGEGEGRDCERLWGGRDARAPGGLSSRNVVAPKEVHRSSCLFVSIRGSSSSNDQPFLLLWSARQRGTWLSTLHSSLSTLHSFDKWLRATSRIPCKGASRPVHRKHCLAACPTNISRPLTTRARFRASRSSRVSRGL